MALAPILRGVGQSEFEAASRSSFLHDLRAILTGRERMLLPLEDVMRAAGMDGQVDRGVQEIPLAKIRGSESRSRDFDASFHPLNTHLRERWMRLYTLMELGREMPPITVYRLGEVYFVRDGHHRVSVARHLDWETIRAHVVEVKTRAPVGADVDSEDLLKVAEYASFLERTHLDRMRPEARLDCSHLGRYDVILQHILGHRYFLSMEQGKDVPLPEAAVSWYDSVYRPVMAVAEQHQLTQHFPGWTETDIYLALTRVWLDLDQEGRPAGPESAAQALLTGEPYAPRPGRAGRRRRRRRSLRLRTRRARKNVRAGGRARGAQQASH